MPARYRSLSGTLVDPEKQRFLDGSDSDSSPSMVSSSRETSGSYQPMLATPPIASSSKTSWAYHLPRRRFSRYFTLFLASSLILFIFLLVKASWMSQAEVRAGFRKLTTSPPAWEQFPFLKRYHGGIRTLVDRSENVVEYPVSEDLEAKRLEDAAMERKQAEDARVAGKHGFDKRQEDWRARSTRFDPFDGAKDTGPYQRVACSLDAKSNLSTPQLLTYAGVPMGLPDPIMGSYDLFGLRNDVCFERYGRLGPYGLGYSKRFGGSGAGMEGHIDGKEEVWGDQLEIVWRRMKWAEAQERCIDLNAHRFKSSRPNDADDSFASMGAGKPSKDSRSSGRAEDRTSQAGPGPTTLPRTAVVIRTWMDYSYDDEDLFYLRALVNELAIQSGGEYTVHFLIHVKDDNLQIWADDATYQRVLDESLPEEFRGMGTLWSERQMGLIYGGVAESFYRDLPVHGVYRSAYMPMQYFAHKHPEYDYFWNWEMDIRYTGHFYHLFDKVSTWAAQQPRKGLWERNGRFYIPSEHGSWDDFRQMVRVQTEHGTASKENIYAKLAADANTKAPMDRASRRAEQPVWGPMPPDGESESVVTADDPIPPTKYDEDNFQWGAGEEADLITFNPLFDPSGTNWILAEDVTGYNTSDSYPPRRTAIVTASRLSRRLLETMHRETAMHRHTMFTEMWPGSCALHHGLKAVYAPHPVYIDRAWPTSYLAAVFNNGRNGAAGGARTSVFSDERQHNFLGVTWYYHSGFGANLWKRWLGYRVDGDGGEEQEVQGEGRMCLPAMLLHPVKHVDLVTEHQASEG